MKFSNTLKSSLSAALLGFAALGMTSTSAAAQTNPATTTFGVSATVPKLHRFRNCSRIRKLHWCR